MEAQGLRQRRMAAPGGAAAGNVVAGTEATDGERAPEHRKDDPTPRPVRPSSSLVGLLSTFVVLGLFVGVIRLRDDNLAGGALLVTKASPAFLFSRKVAMRHVRTIAAKPRWTGSAELDKSIEYVRIQLEAMRSLAERNGMSLEVETFTADGSFASSIGTTDVHISYGNILSVVARLSPVASAGESVDSAGGTLLVNAHIDSAFGAPGGSDNVAGVAVALESVRSLARMTPDMDRLSRPIIFLFNGAEEPLLAGADGFLKTHRWASDIVAHINLESVGAGDSYLLFQLGPGNSWLTQAYARAVKRPSGSVSGSDVFESGLVPGETDFRIFKEAGIPGYDFALTRNGHVYHTRYDDIQHVSIKSIDYGGRVLVIPLALELAGRADAIGKHLSADPAVGKDAAGARAAYFDVLGLFTVVYSASMSAALSNVLLLIGGVLFLFYVPFQGGSPSPSPFSFVPATVRSRLRMLAVFWLCCFAGIASASVAALTYLHVLQRPMSWYGSTRFALAVFVPPFMVGVTTMLQLALPSGLSTADAHESMMHAVSAIYCGIVALMAWNGFLTVYISMTVLFGCILAIVAPFPRSWVFVRFLLVATPCAVFGVPSALELLNVFLGVLGRAGTAPSELIASIIVGACTSLYALGPVLPVYVFYPLSIARVRKWSIWIAILVATFVALLPELTLPHRDAVYSKDAPKRILVSHFYAPQQTPSNVLGLVPFDVIPVDVNTTVRMLPFNDKDRLDHTPQWGMLRSTLSEPVRPFQAFLGQWSIFEVSEPLELAVPTATIISEVGQGSDDRVVTIRVEAPDTMQVTLRIMAANGGGAVKSWSFGDSMNDMGDSQGAFVRHVGRGKGAEELEFAVVVEVDPVTKERPRVEFDVTSSRPGKSRSDVLKLLYFPLWTAPIYAQTTGAGFSL